MNSLSKLTLFKTLPGNSVGKDYVIGDLHGCLPLLEEALALVSFDVTKDRLISVGDLINRGAYSFECLKLLEKPWFHAVAGNHEGMLLSWGGLRSAYYHDGNDFLENGGSWVYALSSSEQDELRNHLLPLVDNLPLVLRVEDSKAPFNVLHADAMGSTHGTLHTDSSLEQLNSVHDEFRVLWGRRMRHTAKSQLLLNPKTVLDVAVGSTPFEPGLSLTYVGHSILRRPLLYRSHVFLDCGAFQHSTGTGHLHVVCHQDFEEALTLAGHPEVRRAGSAE